MANGKNKSLGIDLGTTMSCMAGMVNGELMIIDNRDGERITPSVVCFDKEGAQPVVGSNAILAASSAPENFVYEAKRMLGKGFNHPDIKKALPFWPFKIREIKGSGADKNITDNIGIVVKQSGEEKVYEPVQVSACILNYLAESAKLRLGSFPTYFVITVPAYFHDGAKQRTLDAANIAFAGKKDENNNELVINKTLLAEPTAAAIAYGSIMIKNKMVKDGDEERILVFDLGGGTYDVSVLDFSYDNQYPVGIVRATDGDNFFGGADFDNVLVDMATQKFKELHPDHSDVGMDETSKKRSDLRLRQEAIKIKTSLSTNLNAQFNLTCYRGTRDLTFGVTRTQFERSARHLFAKLLDRVKGVLLSCEQVTPLYTEDGKLDYEMTRRTAGEKVNLDSIIEKAKKEISRVIMVGGSSRIPKVRALLEEFFGENEQTPVAQKRVVSPLNPDEAIAYGAGYHANANCPDREDGAGPSLLLIDSVPLNLNIETSGGVATTLIKARSVIPAKVSNVFSTAADNQTAVDIVITQGNRPVSADNHMIGRFTLSGIASAPRGVPQIEVTYEVDQNNILRVKAVDKATGNEQIYVENMSNKLSEADIKRMEETAKEHAKADEMFVKKVTAKNEYEAMVFQFQDALEKASVPAETKEEITKKLQAEEEWLRTMDNSVTAEQIEERKKNLSAEMMEVMKGSAPGGTTGTDNPNVEEVN